MIVHDRDHDMLMLAFTFRLYHQPVSEIFAYRVSGDLERCRITMHAEEVTRVLVSGGVEALACSGAPETVWSAAKNAAALGHVVLVLLDDAAASNGAIWHMMHDRVRDCVGTLIMYDTPGDAIMAGEIFDAFLGEAVIAAQPVPGWRGSWDEVTAK